MPTFKYTDKDRMQKELKKLFTEEDVTQRSIADYLKIKPQALTKLMNKANFSFEDASRILDAMGFDLVVTFEKRTPGGGMRSGSENE